MKANYTGFEPWGEIAYNPSWDVARSAAAFSGSSAELLPVSFDVVDMNFEGFVVHFGVAIKREYVELERYAHNIKIEDQQQTRRLSESGNVAYETSLNLAAHLNALNADIPEWSFRESRDAGTFVCNALYYSSLSQNSNRLFVHIPMMKPADAKALGRQLARHFDKVSF